jgi:predicted HTH domain antitoxin
MDINLLEDIVEALTEEGGVDPHEIRTEALRLYLNTHPTLKLDGTVALWRQNRVSLAKAAEIAGLTVPELKEVLAARGIIRNKFLGSGLTFQHRGILTGDRGGISTLQG